MFVCLYVCIFVRLYVCRLSYSSKTLCISDAKLSGIHLRPHGRVIYDPTAGSSTTPRPCHLRPHGRVIYDPTAGSSTTPRPGHPRPHGRMVSVFFSRNSAPITFYTNKKITLFVIKYYANNYATFVNVMRLFLNTFRRFVKRLLKTY